MLTDRECAIALFTAVTGLAERLTGERMIVHLQTEDGEVSIISSSVQWERQDAPSGALPHLAAA